MKKWIAVLLAMALGLTLSVASAERYYLTAVNLGCSRALSGNVCMILIYVDTPQSAWTGEEIASQTDEARRAIQALMEESQRFQADLCLSLATAAVSTACGLTEDYSLDWYWDILGNTYGFSGMADMHAEWEAQFEADDLAVIFLFHEEGRSYSYRTDLTNDLFPEEMAVIYALNGNTAYGIMHETLHLFGATDLYYPDTTCQTALSFFPDSVMLTPEGMTVDDLNAFLVGWTPLPTPNAMAFMAAIQSVTEQDVLNGLNSSLYN